MERHPYWKGVVLVMLMASLLAACEGGGARTAYPVQPTYNYVIPSTTYLRDCPGYECGVVTGVFSGDRVVVLDRNDYGWARVQLDRTGAIGWLSADLLSYGPVPSTYYVGYSTVYLRDCADHNCRAVQLLYRGDRVEKLDQDYRGWWRVRSAKTGASGWIPATAVTPRPGPPYYYVNVSSLALRAGPSTGNRILTTIPLNNQVEMLGSGVGGWVQVRDVRTNTIGWVAGRYLESFPVSHPKATVKKRAPGKKSAPEREKAPKAGPKAM